jgi:AraC-like DNA-binding protein
LVNASNDGGPWLHAEFTSISRTVWTELADLSDQAAISPAALTRLRLAVLDLAPTWWVRERQAQQAARITGAAANNSGPTV